MYTVEREIVDELKQKLQSPYAACMFAAKKAKKLSNKTDNVLRYAEALSWAITDIEPKDLKARIERQKRRIAKQQGKITTRLENLLELVDDVDIAKSIQDSYSASIDANKLVFIYNSLDDEGDKARVRIITKIAFYERPVKEDTSTFMKVDF